MATKSLDFLQKSLVQASAKQTVFQSGGYDYCLEATLPKLGEKLLRLHLPKGQERFYFKFGANPFYPLPVLLQIHITKNAPFYPFFLEFRHNLLEVLLIIFPRCFHLHYGNSCSFCLHTQNLSFDAVRPRPLPVFGNEVNQI